MKIDKFQLGIFMLSALALLLAMMFFLGMSDLFVHKAKLTALFSESVQGLAVGSPVKYKGVPIGSVSKISIAVDNKLIIIDMSIDLSAFSTSNVSGAPYWNQQGLTQFIKKEIQEGLRCRLEMSGVTGLKYLEMDYFVAPGTPAPTITTDVDIGDSYIVPTAPSVFQDIVKSLNTSLDRISRIRFEEISDTLVQNLAELNRVLSGPEARETLKSIKNMARNLDQTSESINRVMTEERIERVVALIEQAVANVDKLSVQLSQEVAEAKIKESTELFRRSTVKISAAADSVSSQREAIAVSLDKLARTLDSTRELLDYLSADPGAIIRGKQQPQPQR